MGDGVILCWKKSKTPKPYWNRRQYIQWNIAGWIASHWSSKGNAWPSRKNTGRRRSALVAISFVARVCEMVASCTLWILTAELFSTEIRSTGHSAANAVARIGGFISPYLVTGSAPLRTAGIVFLVVHFTAAFFSSRLPETKGMELGKATDERRNETIISRYEYSGAELI